MRILMIGPGVKFSVEDVFRGYYNALKRAGHEVFFYDLTSRIEVIEHGVDSLMTRKEIEANKEALGLDMVRKANEGIPAMALRLKVDWVMTVYGRYIDPAMLVLLREYGVKVACIFTESPYEDESQSHIAKFANVSFVNDKCSIETISKVCETTYHLPAAYDPFIHKPVKRRQDIDCFFVGTGFPERQAFFHLVKRWPKNTRFYGNWPGVTDKNVIFPFVKDKLIANEGAHIYYSRSKINLNVHRASKDWKTPGDYIEYAYSANPRVFELAGCGAFQLTDYRPEIEEIFGDIIPIFQDADELQEMIEHFMDHPRERRQRAEQAYKAVQDHTFDKRVVFLVECLTQ